MTGVWVESRRARAATNLAVVLNRSTPRSDYPPRVAFEESAYRKSGIMPDPGDVADDGVAGELRAAWRALYGSDAPPEVMVEHVRGLIGG
jgi:hypothetical protein